MIGRVINNYELKSLIGEGGQGSVYLAQHPFIGRKAAVKVMRRALAEDDALVARFMNEALAGSKIGHPNIVDIIDVGRLEDGLPYLMMEHLEGETLGARLRRRKTLPLEEALAVVEQTAAALGAAHAKGIVHRDLKPENLFLARDPEGGERLKVLDFGIAKLLRQDLAPGADNLVTTEGALFGTPTYMSPEQCRGMRREADSRSDIYALGAIAFEMLTGRPPFVSEAAGDILVAHITQPPPLLRSLAPELPEAIEAAIARALAKDANARFSTMAELWQAFRWAAPWITPVLPPALHEPAEAAPPPAPAPATTHRVRRWRWQWAVLPAAALAGLAAYLGLRTPAAPPPTVAQPAAPAPAVVPLPPPVTPPAAAEPAPAGKAARPGRPSRRKPESGIIKW